MPPSDSVLSAGPTTGAGVLAPGPAPAAPAAPAAKPTMRGFDDVDSLRGGIYDSVFKAVSDFEPVANATHTVKLSNPRWVDPADVSRKDRKRAILRNESLGRRLQAEWHLVDNATGQPVASRRSIIATVPKLTDGGTFVQDGIEYTLANQFRLLPGVYTRRKSTGETESHVNTLPGQGVSHRYSLDPAKSVFKMEVGQSSVPLLPVLRALGATDDRLREAWGDKLLAANLPHDTPEAMSKLYDRLLNATERKAEPDKVKAVAAAILKMKLDPAVTTRTLGRPHATLGVDAILDSTRRLLSVYRGEADPDDRDAMPYQKLMAPDDLMAERIRAGRSTVRKLLWKATNKKSLAPLPTGLFDGHIKGLLQSSGLGNAVEEVNPTEMLGQLTRVTRLGEGGISGGVDSVPEESRNVHSSQLGYVDPVLTPESSRAGVDLKLARAARRGSDGKVYTPVRDVRTGEIAHKSPLDLADEPLAFPGEMKGDDDVVTVVHNGKIDRVPRSQVRYEVPHMEHTFNQLANLVPGKSAIKGQRAIMGARMMTQAMALRGGESRLVRAGDPESGDAFDKLYGSHVGAVRADQPGRVTEVTDDRVTVRGQDGKEKTFELHNNLPYNRKSVAGDSVIFVRREGKVSRLAIRDYAHREGDETLSILENGFTSGWNRVTGYLRIPREQKRMLRVTCQSGRSVVVTEDHGLVTLGADGRLLEITPDQCVPGQTRLPVASIVADGVVEHQFIVERTDWESVGLLAGLYLAEGHIPPTYPGLLILAVEPEGRRQEILGLCGRFGVKPHRGVKNVKFTDHDITKWLTQQFGSGSGSKFIPSWVYSAPREFRTGLIRGYMAGDGCLWSDVNGCVQLCAVSTSVRLRDNLIELLGTLDVFCTLWDAPRNYLKDEWNDAYGLRVCSADIPKLPSWFFYADRDAKLKDIGDYDHRTSSFDLIPIDGKLARKEVYRQIKTSGLVVTPLHHKYANRCCIRRSMLSSVVGTYGDWARSDVRWDKVVSVESVDSVTHEYVYDLEVAGTNVFAVDHGLVVHNSFLHQTATVQPGQEILPGDLLARSNYTDDQGHVALGRNLYSAYLPDGNNFEDAVTISASAARDKMASEHLYQHSAEHSDDVKRGKNSFAALMPSAYSRAQMAVLDDDGVIKPGTVVEKGQPLVLGARLKSRTRTKILRGGADAYSNGTEEWDHHNQGVVTDVEKTPKGVVVAVKSYNPMIEGDKIAGTFGDKGLVKIVPDEHMPHDSQGRPFEVLLNPLGVQTRGNPIQVYEAVLSKIAKATGKPYTLNDFGDIKDLQEFTTKEAERHNIPDTETVTDPRTGAKIPGVLTGYRYLMKLHHAAEDKDQGRGLGGYGSDGEPSRGSGAGGGAKRFSVWDTWAMLSHGACFLGSTNVLTDQGYLEISKIVRFRMPVQVACADSAGRIVYRPVVNWFCSSVPESELLQIKTTARVGDDGSGIRGSHQAIKCTKGHKFYVRGGKDHAVNLRPGDTLFTPGVGVTDWQVQMVAGALMGDAYGAERGIVSFVHGDSQQAYLRWKYDKLKQVVNKAPKAQKLSPKGFAKKPTWRFSTLRHETIKKLIDRFYTGEGRKKDPPAGIVAEMGWLGLGVWFADDGSVTVSKQRAGKAHTDKIRGYSLHTCAFSVTAVERLVEELNSFTGLVWSYYLKAGKYPIIILQKGGRDGDQLQRWSEMIRPYLPPDMAYKIREESCGEAWCHLQADDSRVLQECEVVSVEPYKLKAHESSLVYDITVADHHNYIVHGVQVGNTAGIRDAKQVRGQKNEDYWAMFQAGHRPPDPDVPHSYKKFVADLQAAGINPVRKGTRTRLLGMTDKDVDALTEGRTLRSAESVNWNEGLDPISGGLFDTALTGSHGGQKWAAIQLHEPVLNPVFEDPARRLLGLTKDQLRQVMSGQKELNGQTGPAGLQAALKAINVPQELDKAKAEFRSGKKTRRDEAVKKWALLAAADKHGVHPGDWVMSKVPVLPPAFRPVSLMQGNGRPMTADANLLYKELFDANHNLKQLSDHTDQLGAERLALYDAFKGVVGLGDPTDPKNKERGVSGILKGVFGSSPKYGAVNRKLLGTTVDTVGRSVIVPNADLDMDQAGIPEEKAWDVFKPFVVRRLARQGLSPVRAAEMVTKKDPVARRALQAEMEVRPVRITRAPILHRYGTMAFRPVLVPGHSIHLPPVVYKGFGADNDGDQVNYHVPVSDDAVKEDLERLLPSKNLFNVRNFAVHQLPQNEFLAGLYEATQRENDSGAVPFDSVESVVRALRRGHLRHDQKVTVPQ